MKAVMDIKIQIYTFDQEDTDKTSHPSIEYNYMQHYKGIIIKFYNATNDYKNNYCFEFASPEVADIITPSFLEDVINSHYQGGSLKTKICYFFSKAKQQAKQGDINITNLEILNIEVNFEGNRNSKNPSKNKGDIDESIITNYFFPFLKELFSKKIEINDISINHSSISICNPIYLYASIPKSKNCSIKYNDCDILDYNIDGKESSHLSELCITQLEFVECNFTKGGISISNTSIVGKLLFDNCNFKDCEFVECNFTKGGISISNTSIVGKLLFKECNFTKGGISISNETSIVGKLVFDECNFKDCNSEFRLENITCNHLKIVDCKICCKFTITRSVFQGDNVYFNTSYFNNFELTYNEFKTRLFLDQPHFAGYIDIGSSYINIFHVYKCNFVQLISNEFSDYLETSKYNKFVFDKEDKLNSVFYEEGKLNRVISDYIPLSKRQASILTAKKSLNTKELTLIESKKKYNDKHYKPALKLIENTRISIALIKNAYSQQLNMIDANKMSSLEMLLYSLEIRLKNPLKLYSCYYNVHLTKTALRDQLTKTALRDQIISVIKHRLYFIMSVISIFSILVYLYPSVLLFIINDILITFFVLILLIAILKCIKFAGFSNTSNSSLLGLLDTLIKNIIKFPFITIFGQFNIEGYTQRFLLGLHHFTSNHYQNAFLPVFWLFVIGGIGIIFNLWQYDDEFGHHIVSSASYIQGFLSTTIPISTNIHELQGTQGFFIVLCKIFSGYCIWNFILSSRRNIK